MKLRSSLRQAEEFKRSDVWADLIVLIDERINGIISEILTAYDPKTVYRMQGEVSGLVAAKGMVDVLIDLLKDKGGSHE